MSTLAKDFVLPAVDPLTGERLRVLRTREEYRSAVAHYLKKYPMVAMYHAQGDHSKTPTPDHNRFIRSVWEGDTCAVERLRADGTPMNLGVYRRDGDTATLVYFFGTPSASSIVRQTLYDLGVRVVYTEARPSLVGRVVDRGWQTTHQRPEGRERLEYRLDTRPEDTPLPTWQPPA